MEECAGLCGVGSSQGHQCLQKRQRPAETAAADSKRCRQECQGPAEMAAAHRKPSPAEKHVEVDEAARRCAVRVGIASPPPPPSPPPCSLQDLPVEIIWRRCCREEFGVRENLQNPETTGMSYREVYAKLFSYRHILGLWQLNYSVRILLNVVVDGLCITAWPYRPRLNPPARGPIHIQPSFRIRLAERNSAALECLEGLLGRPHRGHLQIQGDRLTIRCKRTDHRSGSPTRLGGERGRGQEDGQRYDCLTYRRLYLPPRRPDDLIRPGLFHRKYSAFGPTTVMLSFHGKYARVTRLMGIGSKVLEIHLRRRIPLPEGEFFRDFDELSRVVREMDEQSAAQPSAGESGAAAAEEQPVRFVLPAGVRSSDQNYPRTCRMCFYGVDIESFAYPRHCCPGVFILFDEDHFGFIWLEEEYFFW
ncbi:F-box only protein 31-like [Myotis daubentonii]|uniref:F-box only protein 31-like n=1 Tax=Myotis daubentonii TaxID=98922 RepID=UPI002872E060|nr:F-box only protein 31-like [Myotis daubentonii]